MPDLDLGAFLASFPWTTFLVGALLSLFLMLALKPVARRTGWVDKPNFRKAHKGEIPLIGGWSILAVAVLLQLAAPAGQRAPLGYWVGGILLFVVAMLDDRNPIRARYRAMVQLGAALAGVTLGGQILPSVGDVLGIGNVSAWWIMFPVSIIGTVAVINAVNFTDGADGLCGGLGFISLFWFMVALMISSRHAAMLSVEPRPA